VEKVTLMMRRLVEPTAAVCALGSRGDAQNRTTSEAIGCASVSTTAAVSASSSLVNRGRFEVTQSVFRGPRSLVVIPAQGIVELRDALTNVLDEFCSPEDLQGWCASTSCFR
jgi:hypothetical protein